MANQAGAVKSVVGGVDISQAAGGNQALQDILNKLTNAANAQATQTNTSSKNPPNPSTATIVFQNPLYILTFVDPGGASAASLAQAAQQAASSPLGSNATNSVIYHQVQAATSPLFDNPSNLVSFGGDSGSLNTQFVMSGLSTAKSWYFRFRTSFDGNAWNTWTLVSKTATAVNPNAVTLEPINGGQFAAVTLPGGQIVGFGVGQVANGQNIQTAAGVLLNNSIGICGPATYDETGQACVGLLADSISALGTITINYADYSSNWWGGNANYLTFGWGVGSDIGAQNIQPQTLADGGEWVVITLPGGSQIAFGSGNCAFGASFDFPAGFIVANSMAVATPLKVGNGAGSSTAHGIKQCNVVNGAVQVVFEDGTGHTWDSSGNWFCVAWSPALAGNVQAVAGGQYILVPTSSGTIGIGVGVTASGGILPLPATPQNASYTYTFPKCLAFSTPCAFVDTGLSMHGVSVCAVDVGNQDSVGTVTMLYGQGSQVWTGSASWLTICWP
jgi:hypothetical protein